MTTFTIPENEIADLTAGGGDEPFPEGPWTAKIREFRLRDLFPGEPGDFLIPDGYENAEELTVQLYQFEPRTGDQQSVGERNFFDDRIILSATKNGIEYAWGVPREDEPATFKWTRRRLTNLARALGMVEQGTNGDLGPTDEFVEAVNTGGEALAERAVGVVLMHETYWSKRDEEEKTNARVQTYEPAV